MKGSKDSAVKKSPSESETTSFEPKQIHLNEPKKDDVETSPSEESPEAEKDLSSEDKPCAQDLEESTKEESKPGTGEVEKSEEKKKDHSYKEKSNKRRIGPVVVKTPIKFLQTGKESKDESSSSEESSSSSEEKESELKYIKLKEAPSEEQINLDIIDDSHLNNEKKRFVEEESLPEETMNQVSIPEISTIAQERNKSTDSKKTKQRLFLKVPNQDAVFVPLRGSSDEDDNNVENKLGDSHNSRTIKSSQTRTTYSEAPNEYAVFVPLKSVPGEEVKSYEEAPETKSSDENNTKNSKVAEQLEVQRMSIEKPVKHKRRLFLKIPNQDAVIVPLHGSSDEDQGSSHADDDDGLVHSLDAIPSTSLTISQQSEELTRSVIGKSYVYEEAPNEYGIIVPLHSFPGEEHFMSKENVENLNRAILTDGSKDQNVPERDKHNNEVVDKEGEDNIKQPKKKQRLFLKVPNQNAVFVPLHGSSDEDENKEIANDNFETSESVTDVAPIQTLQRIYAGAPNEYSIYVPLHASPDEQVHMSDENYMTTDSSYNIVEQTLEKKAENMENEESPIPIQRKQRLFFKVPNQNAVIVPLHGSSDEDEEEVIDEDDGLIQHVSARAESSAESSPHLVTRRKSSAKKIVVYDVAPNEYGLIVPLHGLPNEQEFFARQENTQSVSPSTSTEQPTSADTKNIGESQENRVAPSTETDNKSVSVKKKHRMFMKVPNENAVYVPLHGSSDEEEVLQSETIWSDHKEDETITNDKENTKYKRKGSEVVYIEAPNEYAVLVPLHGMPGEEQTSQTNDSIPTIDGTSSVVNDERAAIVSQETTQVSKKHTKDQQKEEDSSSKKVIKKRRAFKKVPNEDAVIIPLHSSTEESFEEVDHTIMATGNKEKGEGKSSVECQESAGKNKRPIESPNEYSAHLRILNTVFLPLPGQTTEAKSGNEVKHATVSEAASDSSTSKVEKKTPKKSILKKQKAAQDFQTPSEKSEEDNIKNSQETESAKSPLGESDKQNENIQLQQINTDVEQLIADRIQSLEHDNKSLREIIMPRSQGMADVVLEVMSKKKELFSGEIPESNDVEINSLSMIGNIPEAKTEVERDTESGNIKNSQETEIAKSPVGESEKQNENRQWQQINTDVEQLIADRIQSLQHDNKSLREIIMPRSQGMADVVLEVMSKEKELLVKSEEPLLKKEVKNKNDSKNICNIRNSQETESAKSPLGESEKQNENIQLQQINTDVEQLIADRIQSLQHDNKSLREIIMPRSQGMADVVLEVMSKKKELLVKSEEPLLKKEVKNEKDSKNICNIRNSQETESAKSPLGESEKQNENIQLQQINTDVEQLIADRIQSLQHENKSLREIIMPRSQGMADVVLEVMSKKKELLVKSEEPLLKKEVKNEKDSKNICNIRNSQETESAKSPLGESEKQNENRQLQQINTDVEQLIAHRIQSLQHDNKSLREIIMPRSQGMADVVLEVMLKKKELSVKSEEPLLKKEVKNEKDSKNICNIKNSQATESAKSPLNESEKQNENIQSQQINTDVEQLIADRIQSLQHDNKSLREIIMPRSQGLADVVLEVMSKKKELFCGEESNDLLSIEEVNSLSMIGNVPEAKKPPINQSPSYQEDKRDHEYEPIQVARAASQPDVRSYPLEVNVKKEEEEDKYEVVRPQEILPIQETTTNLQAEGGYEVVEEPKHEQRRFIKIPNEDAVIVPLHGSSDEEINPDRYQNPSLMMSEDDIERMPTKTPTINVHAPEDVTTPAEHNEGTIQERLKSQADRFTTKLRGISKPKIKLPERPNIKMPEMPKLKLSEKFHLPERPKFHFPDKSKFHLPERPKFHFPEKPKFLTERPKFKLPERPRFGHHEKKTKPKGKKPNPSSLRRPLRDVVTISSQSTPGSTHNIFETLKFRTYPRFFKKKKPPAVQKMSSLETESSQPSTPPARPRSYSAHQQQDTSWVHAYQDNKFADEETNLRVERMEEEYEKDENTAPFQENYGGSIKGMVEREFKQGKAESMTSVVSEKGSSGSSSNRRRAGVIEEIDSDEFFVREKGLSREDVDVSRYLSLEIRDAFRQPKNALASLDNDLYDYDEQDIPFEHIPRAPQRSKSGKSTSADREKEFHTFPKRPSRRKESDPEVVVKPPRRFRSKSGSVGRYRGRQSSMPSLNSEIEAAPEPPRRKSRERSIKSLTREGRVSDIGDDIVQTRLIAQHSEEIPPVAPLRKSRSRGTSLADDDRTSRGADSAILPDDDEGPSHQNVEREEMDEQIIVDDEIEEESLDLEDEEDSRYKTIEPVRVEQTLEVDERMTDHSGYAVVAKGRKKPPPRPPPPPQQHFHFQSQFDTIKNTGKNIFFTYPRRAIRSLHKPLPNRPIRNYNTVGPVRPPRRNRVFRQPLYITGESPAQHETFADKERDLQSGEVVMKMKGRPLPAPPRPPRKTKEFDILTEDYNSEITPADTIIANTEVKIPEVKPEIKESRLDYLKAKKEEIFKSLQEFHKEDDNEEEEILQRGIEKQTTTAQQTSFDFGEVSVSIQTDPLPKDVIVIDQEIEETEEIFILPDRNKKELVERKEEISESESKIKARPTVESNERKREEKFQSQSQEEEDIETNIFQQALERVEAAKGVLKEARERVIPGSSSSLEERKLSEESPIIRGSSREALPASSRSDDVEKEETPPPLPARPLYTKPIPVSFPDKLHLSELDVDKLNVGEIQANKISVSEIESTCIEVTELTSRGGNLTVHGIELPPDFISNIVAQVTSQAQIQVQNQQLAARELTPQRQMRRVLTPPPSIVVQATSEPVALPEPIIPETEATEHIPQPRTTRSKGRKLQSRVIDDSEDELAYTMPKRREKAKSERDSKEKIEEESNTKNEEESKAKRKEELKSESDPKIEVSTSLQQANSLQLVRRLVSIWHGHAIEGAKSFVQGVNSLFPEGEKRRDAQIALIILLILITGLILLGFGYDNSVHHHHWDYLPPR